MKMRRLWIAAGRTALLLLLAVGGAPIAADQIEVAAPGSDRVDGDRLRPYSATWDQSVLRGADWTVGAQITEELREGDADRWVRVQTTVQGPLTVVVAVEADRRTLRPISLRRRFEPMPPEPVAAQLEAAGLAREVEVDFGETGYVVRSTLFSGEQRESRGDFGMPFYDGSILGLVVAAADIGRGVRLPVLFLGNDGGVTEYWVDATLGGTERLDGFGDAARVDVGWLDFGSDVVTSEAGHDAAGGAYWIAEDLARARAPVPRYKNESVDILIQPGG